MVLDRHLHRTKTPYSPFQCTGTAVHKAFRAIPAVRYSLFLAHYEQGLFHIPRTPRAPHAPTDVPHGDLHALRNSSLLPEYKHAKRLHPLPSDPRARGHRLLRHPAPSPILIGTCGCTDHGHGTIHLLHHLVLGTDRQHHLPDDLSEDKDRHGMGHCGSNSRRYRHHVDRQQPVRRCELRVQDLADLGGRHRHRIHPCRYSGAGSGVPRQDDPAGGQHPVRLAQHRDHPTDQRLACRWMGRAPQRCVQDRIGHQREEHHPRSLQRGPHQRESVVHPGARAGPLFG